MVCDSDNLKKYKPIPSRLIVIISEVYEEQGGHVPPIFGLGGHYHECPSQYFYSNITYFLSMQYFLDKLKEF